MNTLPRIAALILLALSLGACEQGAAPAAGGAGRVELGETQHMHEAGDYIVRVNAIPTADVPAEVASKYRIARSESRVMLNVAMMKRAEVGLDTAVTGTVVSQTSNLAGQLKRMAMREIVEDTAIYYIGEIPVSDGETLIFDVDATPEGETEPVRLRFRRKFYTD